MTSILLLVLAAFLGLLFLSFRKPNSFRLERSALIKAPPDTIFPHLNDLRLWNTWSPWAKKDPAMKQTYSGPHAGRGAAHAWTGNSQVGRGRMEIIDSVASSKVQYQLDFESPMVARNVAEITLTPEGDATRVTWVMSGPVSFPAKIMHTLFDMDRMIGNDFEAGLSNLRDLVEP